MWNVSGWTIRSTDVGHDEAITNGNRLLIGNGFLGYRGTVEESRAEDMPATIVNGLYDRNGDKWREPVNFPNALSVRLFAGDSLLSPASAWLVSHEQALDFRYGVHSRKTVWAVPLAEFSGVDGAPVSVTVEAERFASMDDVGLLCLRYTVLADGDAAILVETGIDGIVNDVNGPHLSAPVSECIDGALLLSCRTQELGVPLSVASSSSLEGGVSFLSASFFASKRLTLNVRAGKRIEFFVYGGISAGIGACFPDSGNLSSDDVVPALARRVAENAVSTAERARSAGWEKLLAKHREKWDAIWATGDVEIEGDDYAQSALRYSLYHLQIIAPRHAKNLSIPARGLSGQTYKGAIFWDTEMFIAPYFLATDPDVVKSFIRYRIGTLGGARRKAAEYGHAGAFYAWESQESGDDACSDFNVVDVFTKRPLRTYFRDRQIHISADVVYALREYIDATGDRSLLAEGGLEMAVECARFFMSWAVWSPLRGRYEIHDVIGPDEYHERVSNNAFTNRMIANVFETTLMLIDETERDDPSLLASVFSKTGFRPFVGLLREMREKLYVPEPGENSVIEQFDGYYKLEDCSVADVRSRLLDPKEYWGGGNGVASNTRVIKQADVVLMMTLFGGDYTAAEKKANLDFYEPRTEHGSSLSACVYSLLACETGDSAWGYPFFVKSAEIDMTGQSKHFAGLVYIGGTHPAANGGAWMSAIRGFCGLSLRGGKVSVTPRLPERWTRVSFHARSGGKDFLVNVTKDGYTVCER